MGLFGKNKIAANDAINGTFGRVFINGHKFANIKSFEAKLTLEYEEIDIAEDAGKHQKFRDMQEKARWSSTKWILPSSP